MGILFSNLSVNVAQKGKNAQKMALRQSRRCLVVGFWSDRYCQRESVSGEEELSWGHKPKGRVGTTVSSSPCSLKVRISMLKAWWTEMILGIAGSPRGSAMLREGKRDDETYN